MADPSPISADSEMLRAMEDPGQYAVWHEEHKRRTGVRFYSDKYLLLHNLEIGPDGLPRRKRPPTDHLPDAAKKVSAHLPCAEGVPAPFSWAVPAFSLPVDPVEFWAGVFLVGWWVLM